MKLTAEQAERILVDVVLGRPLRESGPEAVELATKIQADIKEMDEMGITPAIPHEVPDVE